MSANVHDDTLDPTVEACQINYEPGFVVAIYDDDETDPEMAEEVWFTDAARMVAWAEALLAAVRQAALNCEMIAGASDG